ncbi:protein FAM180A [Chanos chanos]|uniref:Protein FAM180A n=1 Tax=Chanos chanos TaxID=29144 RepID=A0A6J2W941_CHACN|nr:protein FAM180A [Chanos chanos]
MIHLKIFTISILYCNIYMSAALHWKRALYPSAYRVKRSSAALVNPIFQKTVEDTDLLYEILLSGMHLEEEDSTYRIEDEELASLRKVKALEVICEDVLPRSLSEIRRLGHQLAQRHGILSKEDFERTVLTMVFIAQRSPKTTPGHQRAMWADAMLELYKAIKGDLRPQ